MKNVIVSIMTIMILCFFTGCASMETKTYNEFTDTSTVELKISLLFQSWSINRLSFFHYSGGNFGENCVGDGHIRAMLFCANENWYYLNCHHLYFLVDGESFEMTTNHEGSVPGCYVTEYIWFDTTPAFLAKIKNAKTIKFKLCNTVVDLKPNQIDNIKQFLNNLT